MSRALIESNRLRGLLWLTEMDQHPAGTEDYIGGDPNRMDETIAQPNANDLQKVKEILLKQAGVNAKNNGYWLGVLSTYNRLGVDTYTNYNNVVKSVDGKQISDFLKNVLLKTGNHTEVIMKAVKSK